MAKSDIESVLQSTSIIISGAPKVGKITFLLYLLQTLFKTKAILFTTQEKFLFERRLKAISSQFQQFSNIEQTLVPFYLKENWHNLKQKYGFNFFITEMEHIMATSEEKIVVMHRVGEYFEFQDRYEIENVYKALIKAATLYDKKIIFIANDKHENFEFIKSVADEFSDVAVTIDTNANSNRLVNIKNLFAHQEYPSMLFKIVEKNFILEYEENLTNNKNIHTRKNVLIAELDAVHNDTKEICQYLFNQPELFNTKQANTLQSILKEIFIRPEIIIVFMTRKTENFETTQTIKQQLPNATIIAVLDQDFLRAEDKREAYVHGIDELFCNDIVLDNLVLSLEKASKSTFYKSRLDLLDGYDNVITDLKKFQELADLCMQKAIYFTAFVLKTKEMKTKEITSGRKYDYVYYKGDKLYYLAVNTNVKHTEKIIESFKRQNVDVSVVCDCVSTKQISVNECII